MKENAFLVQALLNYSIRDVVSLEPPIGLPPPPSKKKKKKSPETCCRHTKNARFYGKDGRREGAKRKNIFASWIIEGFVYLLAMDNFKSSQQQ